MSASHIDLQSVASAVSTILDERVHGAQAARQAAEREATIRAQREAEQAAETARVAHQAAMNQLTLLENTERGVKSPLDSKAKQYGALGREINELSGQHNFLLAQLHSMRKQLGLKGLT